MTTGQLIDLLIKDLKPEWSFNRIILLAIGMGTLISASAFLVAVGFRADIAGAIHSWRFLLKFVLTGTLAVSTTGMLSNLGRPNGAPERWGWGAAVASAMLVCAIAVELMTPARGQVACPSRRAQYAHLSDRDPAPFCGAIALLLRRLAHGGAESARFRRRHRGSRGERNRRDILRGQLHRRQSAIRRDLVPARDPCGLDHRLFRGKALAALVADNQKIPPAVTAARGERPRPVADKNGLSWSTSVKKVALSVSLKAKPGKERRGGRRISCRRPKSRRPGGWNEHVVRLPGRSADVWKSLTASAVTRPARRISKALSPPRCWAGPTNCSIGPRRSIPSTFSRRSCRLEQPARAEATRAMRLETGGRPLTCVHLGFCLREPFELLEGHRGVDRERRWKCRQ